MELVTNFIYVLIKLIVLSVIIYVLHFKLSKKNQNDFISYLVSTVSLYASVAFSTSFVLLLLHSYDTFNVLFIVFIFSIFHYYNFIKPLEVFNKLKKSLKVAFEQWLFWIDSSKKQKFLPLKKLSINNKSFKQSLLILTLITISVSVSKYWFYAYDNYLMSQLWFNDIETIFSIKNQNWDFSKGTVLGSYLLIDLYSKFTNQTIEFSLQSFGLIEYLSLTVILYWFVLKVGNTNKFIAFLCSLIFVFAYKIAPLNLSLIATPKAVFLALVFSFPVLNSINNLSDKKLNIGSLEFISILLLFIVIGLINLSVFVIVLLPALLINTVQFRYNKLINTLKILVGYIIVFASILLIYKSNGVTPLDLLKSNFIIVSSYTNTNHLIFPLNKLLLLTQIISWVTLLLCFTLNKLKKNHNRGIVTVLLVFNFLVVLNSLELTWIDLPQLYQLFSVLIPVVLAFTIAVLYRLIKLILIKQLSIVRQVVLPSFGLGFLVLFIYYNTISLTNNLSKTDNKHWSTLNALTKINKNYLPYSYAVVNLNEYRDLSRGKYYFIDKQEFNSSYLERDQLYQIIKLENKLKEKPHLVLPNSVLIFIYKYPRNQLLNKRTKKILRKIEERNRKTRSVYKDTELEVLEIINQDNSSKIAELMFN